MEMTGLWKARKAKTRFPTLPSHFAITTAVLFSLIPAAFGCQNRRWAAEKGAIPQPPAALIFRIILYWNRNSISESFFDWKMLVDTRRAVQAFRQMAAQTDNSIQLVIPLKEVVDLIQRGLRNLALSPFTKVAGQVMDYEVTALVGPKIRPKPHAQTCAGAASQATAWWADRRSRWTAIARYWRS